MTAPSRLSDLAAWASEDRGCGAQAIADTLRRSGVGEEEALRALLRWKDGGTGVLLATVTESDNPAIGPGARIACADDGRLAGSLGDSALEESVARAALDLLRGGTVRTGRWARDADGEWTVSDQGGTALILEPFLPRWEVVVVGSGKVPEALAGICHAAGIPVRAYEARADSPDLPGARETVRGPWEEVAGRLRLGVGSHCVVATPRHEGDEAAVRALLSLPHLPYVGLMHNERKAAKLVESLRASGTRIDGRFRCPIGLAVATRNPGEIAVGIIAEILSVANGMPARPMGLDWTSPATAGFP